MPSDDEGDDWLDEPLDFSAAEGQGLFPEADPFVNLRSTLLEDLLADTDTLDVAQGGEEKNAKKHPVALKGQGDDDNYSVAF